MGVSQASADQHGFGLEAGRVARFEKVVKEVVLGDKLEFLQVFDPDAIYDELAMLSGNPGGLVDDEPKK